MNNDIRDVDTQIEETALNIAKLAFDEIIRLIWEDQSFFIKLGFEICKFPSLVIERYRWEKFERLARGIKSDPVFETKFADKITNSENRDQFAKRIVAILDKIDEIEKVDFIINATRALCWNKIDHTGYFRICHVIKNVYYEDLIFLKENFRKGRFFKNDITVQALTLNNLMYAAVLGGGTSNLNEMSETHTFTELGCLVCEYSLNYEKVNLLN